MATIKQLNPPRACGYPKILDISASAQKMKADVHDPNFNEPLDKIFIDYSAPKEKGGMLFFKIRN